MNDWDKMADLAMRRVFKVQPEPHPSPLVQLLILVLAQDPETEAANREQEAVLELAYKAPATADRMARQVLERDNLPTPQTAPELNRWAGNLALLMLTSLPQAPVEQASPQERRAQT
jgi:hypothetical protein